MKTIKITASSARASSRVRREERGSSGAADVDIKIIVYHGSGAKEYPCSDGEVTVHREADGRYGVRGEPEEGWCSDNLLTAIHRISSHGERTLIFEKIAELASVQAAQPDLIGATGAVELEG